MKGRVKDYRKMEKGKEVDKWLEEGEEEEKSKQIIISSRKPILGLFTRLNFK